MTNEEILEGNKLIANFLGESVQEVRLSKDVTLLAYGEEDEMPDYVNIVYFQPDCDWNILMFTIDKISKVGNYDIRIHIYGSELETFSDIMDETNDDCLEVSCIHNNFDIPTIITVYKSVIEFIKWYNNQPKS